jgi:hypothetical protein
VQAVVDDVGSAPPPTNDFSASRVGATERPSEEEEEEEEAAGLREQLVGVRAELASALGLGCGRNDRCCHMLHPSLPTFGDGACDWATCLASWEACVVITCVPNGAARRE